MEACTISTLSRVSIPSRSYSNSSFFNISSPSFFKFNHQTSKHKISSLSVSCKTPSNSKPLKTQFSYGLSVNPFWFIVPVLHSIREFITSRSQNSSFLLRNSVQKWFSCLKSSNEWEGFSDGGESQYLQSGGIGMTLLSTTTMVKVRASPFLATLAVNPTFMSGLVGWVIAQSMKFFLHFVLERKWDLGILFSSGGMPSSHSALCMALTTSVAICHGVGDSLFPVCLGFSLIVMYGATGVRRHAGMQAEVLNMIVEDLFQGHPISQRKLKELLGHTPSQVIAGAILGILVACFCCQGGLVAI